MTTPTDIDNYFFDLQGYLILRNALSAQEVKDINDSLDSMPRLKPDQWHGYVHRENMPDHRGTSLQQIYEAGKPFEKLIDHPSWINHVTHYVGAKGTFDSALGDLFIDENFALFRGPGESITLHSGGHTGCIRTQFAYHNGGFHCGQINILMALTDIGPGDGATMVIPGSHKSNLEHPHLKQRREAKTEFKGSAEGLPGAIEVHLNKGDVLLFVDALAHGSAERKNPGQRRIMVYRYGPSWGNFRFGYQPSQELLDRLTPAQRKIVHPQLVKRPPQVLKQNEELVEA